MNDATVNATNVTTIGRLTAMLATSQEHLALAQGTLRMAEADCDDLRAKLDRAAAMPNEIALGAASVMAGLVLAPKSGDTAKVKQIAAHSGLPPVVVVGVLNAIHAVAAASGPKARVSSPSAAEGRAMVGAALPAGGFVRREDLNDIIPSRVQAKVAGLVPVPSCLCAECINATHARRDAESAHREAWLASDDPLWPQTADTEMKASDGGEAAQAAQEPQTGDATPKPAPAFLGKRHRFLGAFGNHEKRVL